MAKARFCKGLRRGSTKTETYSTLSTRKFGRIQVIKDRVTDVSNPQTNSQMTQRVIFATVTKAAAIMASLIEIARENQPDRNFARQEFITENVAFIRSVAGRRIGARLHYLAAYAPKGNQQLIPNSYIVSKGSLQLPTVNNFNGDVISPWLPIVSGDKGSFGDPEWQSPVYIGALPYGNYTHEQLWKALFGLQPGDQLTFPQIIGGTDPAQVMLDGSNIVDKTIFTKFAAPRLVLKDTFDSQAVIQINENVDLAALKAALNQDVDAERSYGPVAAKIIDKISIDDTADEIVTFILDDSLANVVSVEDTYVRALGTILSRKVNEKWYYSTCQLICVWDFIGNTSGEDYFGFTLDNAIETYLPTSATDANGNFLQRGGESDIMPPQ